jgi:hypothetical protein
MRLNQAIPFYFRNRDKRIERSVVGVVPKPEFILKKE